MVIQFPASISPEILVFGYHGFDDSVSHDLADAFWGSLL